MEALEKPSSESIAGKRCFNHAQREAVARCPECGRFFCRECVTEHRGRVLCAVCINAGKTVFGTHSGILGTSAHALCILIGFFLLWFCFYYTGQALLSLPDTFHNGTFWQSGQSKP